MFKDEFIAGVNQMAGAWRFMTEDERDQFRQNFTGCICLLDEIVDLLETCAKDVEAEPAENGNLLLWNELAKHAGNDVHIVTYGREGEEPVNVALEDWDTNEIILDAGIYTLKARDDI